MIILLAKVIIFWMGCMSSPVAPQAQDYPLLYSDHCDSAVNSCPLECGIGRESQLMDDSCFEWHKSVIPAQLMNGRSAMIGEVPYVVFIKIDTSECTGVLVTDRMVITAAHCLVNARDILVVTGERNMTIIDENIEDIEDDYIDLPSNIYNVSHFEVFPSPLTPDQRPRSIDIGILFTSTPVKMIKYESAIVCLPEPNTANTDFGYALFSGFGDMGFKKNDKTPFATSLQMGWMRVLPMANNATDISGDIILAKIVPHPGGTNICKGDSGGPLIQYINGRAVLIGILSGELSAESYAYNCVFNDTILIGFARVSRKVDWILDTYRNWIQTV